MCHDISGLSGFKTGNFLPQKENPVVADDTHIGVWSSLQLQTPLADRV